MNTEKQLQSGVTLIELMVVMVIVAILAAIAIPSYRQYIIRANRADAKTALLAMAGRLERCFTQGNAYDNPACLIDTTAVPSSEGHYLIDAEIPTPTEYTLTAVPQGGQVDDTQCGSFTLTHRNVEDVSGSLSATPNECWGK